MFEYNAIVRSLYDGDTVRLDIDLGMNTWLHNESVRVLGIDAPEMNTQAGKDAKAFALSLMPMGTKVVITTTKDKKEKYGRYLASITLPGQGDFATLMVKEGHAKTYFGGKRE